MTDPRAPDRRARARAFGDDGNTNFALPNVAPLESANGAPVSICISLLEDDPAGRVSAFPRA